MADSPNYDSIFLNAAEGWLAHERGYVSDPDDPGGATNFGISQSAYPALDIKNLTRDGAIALIFSDYWKRFGIDRLRIDLSAKVLDMSAPMGGLAAVRCLQRAVCANGVKLKDDGLIGRMTIAAINAYSNPQALRAAFASECAGYFRLVAQRRRIMGVGNPNKFLEGWLDRAYS